MGSIDQSSQGAVARKIGWFCAACDFETDIPPARRCPKCHAEAWVPLRSRDDLNSSADEVVGQKEESEAA